MNVALMAVTITVAVVLGTNAPQLYQKWKGNGRAGDYAEHVANQPQQLTLYGTTTCEYCGKAREHLRSAGIPFNDRIVDKSKEASDLFAKLNESSVPVLVSKRQLLVGFNSDEYEKFLLVSVDK